MSDTAIQPRPELLQVADAVAREKSIDRDEVLEAMEQAIQKAARSKYGHELDIRAKISRSNGEIHLARYREVVDEVERAGGRLSRHHGHALALLLAVGQVEATRSGDLELPGPLLHRGEGGDAR